MSFRLYKIEKLCSKTAVELLFSNYKDDDRIGGAALSYPWRLVWRVNDNRSDSQPRNIAQFLITVPKKRVRHAVDRVLLRRRCREAYRLNRHLLPQGVPLDLAFLYVGKVGWLASYGVTVRSVVRLLSQIKIVGLEEELKESHD